MRKRIVIRMESVYRKLMLRYMADKLPIILITEYPKSGASWLGQLLSEIMGIPFPRQEIPRFGKAIYHGHYIKIKETVPTIVFWRDPRDIIVSWYHHCLFNSDKNHPSFVAQHRAALAFDDIEDIKKNLMSFIQFIFEKPISPRFSINDFVDFWHGREGVIECSYERLMLEPERTLVDILKVLDFDDFDSQNLIETIEKYSFAKQANRKPGEENPLSYLRKGVVGDWVNYFTPASAELLNEYLGDRLIQLGYEEDHSWVVNSFLKKGRV